MKKQTQPKQSLRAKRIFSESIKKQAVKDIESGKCTVAQVSNELLVSQNSVYVWINRYSRYLRSNKTLIVEDKSESYRSKELERKVKELEAALGRKQMEIDFMKKMMEIAEDKYGVDFKKKSPKIPSSGSGSTKESDTGTK